MRRPQFSLRSLFILTALVAVGLLVGPPVVQRAHAWLYPPQTSLSYVMFTVTPRIRIQEEEELLLGIPLPEVQPQPQSSLMLP